jgi:hypothetical protein
MRTSAGVMVLATVLWGCAVQNPFSGDGEAARGATALTSTAGDDDDDTGGTGDDDEGTGDDDTGEDDGTETETESEDSGR